MGRRALALAYATLATSGGTVGSIALAALSTTSEGCGSRTELIVIIPREGGPIDSGVADAASVEADVTIDTQADTTIPIDAPVDSPGDAPEEPMVCMADADCTTTTFCKPMGMCGPNGRCVYPERSCDDGVACTDDECDERAMTCTHSIDDSMCPDSELCSPTRGCATFIYAVGVDSHLYELGVPPASATIDLGLISGGSPSDIALASDGTLYMTDSYDLYTVDRATGASTETQSILPLHMYAGLGTLPMAGAPLYSVADTNQVFSIDAMSGDSNLVAQLLSGYEQDGDISAVNGTLYVTVLSPNGMTDTLGLIDPNAMVVTPIGDTGMARVYGLATLGGVLYGLTTAGEILQIDTTTGAAQTIGMGPPFQGAAGR